MLVSIICLQEQSIELMIPKPDNSLFPINKYRREFPCLIRDALVLDCKWTIITLQSGILMTLNPEFELINAFKATDSFSEKPAPLLELHQTYSLEENVISVQVCDKRLNMYKISEFKSGKKLIPISTFKDQMSNSIIDY